jgi:hypothetical protein
VKSRTIMFMFMLIIGLATASAQALPETAAFDSGSAFSYPADWTLGEADGATITVTGEFTSVTVMDYPYFEEMGLEPETDLAAAQEVYFSLEHSGDFDNESAADVTFGERQGLRFDYEDASGVGGILIALPLTDGGFGMVDATALQGKMQDEEEVLAIAESFDSGSAEAAPAQTGAACTVSTDQERTVRVHVGPGENRGALAFLPANREFEVAGQNTADDGSVWWRLADATQVKPNAATSEAWVAEGDVVESGDCASLGTAVEPPIRVQIVAPPPQENTTEGDTSAPPSAGGLPQPGTWTVNYPGIAAASCIGEGITQETIYVSVSSGSETVPLTLTSNGFILGDRVHTPMGDNRYRGQWDFEVEGDVLSAESFLTVVSPTQMRGELHVTIVFGGGACSATGYINITRN